MSGYKRLVQRIDGEVSCGHFSYALALAGNGRVLAVGATFNDRDGTESGGGGGVRRRPLIPRW